MEKSTNKTIDMAIKDIEQEPRWIPVSERMPNNEDYVLVCYEDGNIRTAYYYIDTNIYESEFEDCCETGWYNYNEDFMYKQDVIAWMPLPKPYEPKEREEYMKITIVEYGSTEHHINCKSFEFRTNQVENWIRIKYQDNSQEKIYGIATIKAESEKV